MPDLQREKELHVEVRDAIGKRLAARPLREDEGITVGRARGCELTISDRSISQRHLQIRYARESILVEDLGSSNGTYLGTTRLERGVQYEVPFGSYIRLGRSTSLWVKVGGDVPDHMPGVGIVIWEVVAILWPSLRYPPTRDRSGSGDADLTKQSNTNSPSQEDPMRGRTLVGEKKKTLLLERLLIILIGLLIAGLVGWLAYEKVNFLVWILGAAVVLAVLGCLAFLAAAMLEAYVYRRRQRRSRLADGGEG